MGHEDRIFRNPAVVARHKYDRCRARTYPHYGSRDRCTVHFQRRIYGICRENITARAVDGNIDCLFLSKPIQLLNKIPVCDAIIIPPAFFTLNRAEKL